LVGEYVRLVISGSYLSKTAGTSILK